MMIHIYLMLLCSFMVQGKIGYFWHITDIHYDPKYSSSGTGGGSTCWNTRSSNIDTGHIRPDRRVAGVFGNYSCDSPWALIESAVQAMKSKQDEGIEFVLWTGDALTHAAEMSEELRLQSLKNLTDLLSHTFTSQFVFPALGHEDVGLNFSQTAILWKHWLPSEALQTFEKSGYYMVEQKSKKYRIILLNTNLWLDMDNIDSRFHTHQYHQHQHHQQHHQQQRTSAGSTTKNSSDPHNQWRWFESVLRTAREKKDTVYVVGHTPPGVDERDSGARPLKEQHNRRYLQIVRQYADIIAGQFFGHWHSDTFRTIYSDLGVPISWIMMAPSITPGRPNGPNNPGLRLYKFETSTGQILDYIQYYLDLPKANSIGRANWVVEYSLLDYYELKEINAHSLHDLADRFTKTNDNAFVRYYAANTVSLPRDVEEIWGCGGAFSGTCMLQHYCAVTRVNPESYSSCLSSFAYPLSTDSSSKHHLYIILYILGSMACLLTSR
ncbi:acid sphingomyelinase-like phosphodiesterase 3b [Microplitis demolitor]|uniref:acid sphingomyelinase-like phosphodiesterase 3b n=1 Tax=Microplitis demolitor TaxID=69319 RepID=UPI0004CCC1DB|nr:acid sphingomyelinase-like phosphodiesterase 3b [Microplitis demolitor]XP_008554404.1 acid sphingomyelinase-like phosphodiesterase 3b [Microplitis demolitor]XP_053594204.1 acid sphingomyelinase-like phosphodiesterase 3b [Microplitis demolitor]